MSTNKPCYTVEKVDTLSQMTADPAGLPWEKVNVLEIDNYPWYSAGKKQRTTVRACYDAENIHLIFECEDVHIAASAREPNGPVCQDSCVEFFAGPPDTGQYFNLEINCCGDILLGYGQKRQNRILADPALIRQIEVATTVQERPKHESPDDDGWILQVRLPLEVLNRLTGQAIKPSPGERWRANFYRCGGRTDPQYACWSPIQTPSPDFHRPEFFGTITFGG